MIQELINKQDNFEIIRDQINLILLTELKNQKLLAIEQSLNPDLWDIDVYSERSNIFENYLNDVQNVKPLLNVWYDNSSFIESSSNTIERQLSESLYNIDCYAVANSQDNTVGHLLGDVEASLSLQRVVRLIRNIIMAAEYTYLGLQGLVWQRWIQSINIYQPPQDRNNVRPVVAARITLRIKHNEYSPQYEGDVLELITGSFKRADDGKLILNLDYQYLKKGD